jgi:hypothetical protein
MMNFGKSNFTQIFKKRRKISMKASMNPGNTSGVSAAVKIAVFAALLIVLMFFSSNSYRNSTNSHLEGMVPNVVHVKSGLKTNITEGVVGGVPYLHCYPLSTESIPVLSQKNLILLHGAKFTKEDWRKESLMEKFCRDMPVTALDLDKHAGYMELRNVLDALQKESMCQFPVNIVTPSASGFTIIDWLQNINELTKYVHRWIPVASPAIASTADGLLGQLKGRIDILAIYGDRDSGGKLVSERLEQLCGAQVVEIPGGHPCYFDSPDRFVTSIRSFLGS